MTKKHFAALAATLNANHADLALVADMADMCEGFSDTFDRATFFVASTINLRADNEFQARQLASHCRL